jgi:hypothetical protein
MSFITFLRVGRKEGGDERGHPKKEKNGGSSKKYPTR